MADALCEVCCQDLRSAPACVINDAVYAFGDEPDVWDPPLEPDEKCRDCGVTSGHAHHFCCAVACCRPCSDENGVLVQRFLCDCWCEQADALGLEAPEVPYEWARRAAITSPWGS